MKLMSFEGHCENSVGLFFFNRKFGKLSHCSDDRGTLISRNVSEGQKSE